MHRIDGNRSYEYKSVRVDGVPTKVYIGRGPDAEDVRFMRALLRREAERERAEFEAMAERGSATDAEADRIADGAEALAEAVLLAAGFHRPRRKPWRRRCQQSSGSR